MKKKKGGVKTKNKTQAQTKEAKIEKFKRKYKILFSLSSRIKCKYKYIK